VVIINTLKPPLAKQNCIVDMVGWNLCDLGNSWRQVWKIHCIILLIRTNAETGPAAEIDYHHRHLSILMHLF